MRWQVNPPMADWRPESPTRRGSDFTIATGHQAQFWHPGILAKDVAMRIACDQLGAAPLHLVVDHDTHEALTLALPQVTDDRLAIRTLRLADHHLEVPTGYHPPVDVEAVMRKLRDANDARLEPFVDAWSSLPDCRTLAQQVAGVAAHLWQPYVGEIPLGWVSDMIQQAPFKELVEAMLDDAPACVRAYNAAVRAHPLAGIGPLQIGREWIELPLWAVSWNAPRRRVYADVADRKPLLVFEDGQEVDRQTFDLAPRAMSLSAAMRSFGCDLFIHGKGGDIYDQATQAWWEAWQGQPLGPMAMATADLYLDFEVPVAQGDTLRDAVWFAHHLPHNLDRQAGAVDPRKRELLEHMDDDRDRWRRRAAFKQLHAINARLAREHPKRLEQADRQLAQARLGVANRDIAAKRDWCFALYPESELRSLIASMQSSLTVPRDKLNV